MVKKHNSFRLLHQDNECQSMGEGITRTSSPKAIPFKYQIQFNHGDAPMKGIINAMDERQARTFLQKRHPSATHIIFL